MGQGDRLTPRRQHLFKVVLTLCGVKVYAAARPPPLAAEVAAFELERIA